MALDRRPGIRRAFHLGGTRPEHVAADMDDELRFHLEARVAHLVARGLSPDEARAAARQRLGIDPDTARRRLHASARHKEQTMASKQWIADVASDMRYALRGLLRRPSFTLVAVLTLAIGIGANTAIFSAVSALLLRPLPFPEPTQLMDITLQAPSRIGGTELQTTGGAGGGPQPWSFVKYEMFAAQQRSFEDVALWRGVQRTITEGEAERLDVEDVSARYLSILGVRPSVGRDFDPAIDKLRSAPPQVVISQALWNRRFNADPAVIGRSIRINSIPHEILGVLPSTFRGLSGRADVLFPVTLASAEDLGEAWSLEYSMIGRLRAGVSEPQARSEAATLGVRIYEAAPMNGPAASENAGTWSAGVAPLNSLRVAPTIRRSLLVLFGAVGFVLLIACVNLANLLLGRANVRQREIAIRLAIGAGRARLVRFLLAESLVLSLMGGAASLLVAWWGISVLRAVNPQAALSAQNLAGLGIVGFASISLDGWALAFTFAVALLVGIAFGLVPALQATRLGLQQQLKAVDATVHGHGMLRGVTTRRLLVVTEVALAIVLLAGAGLMVRSLGQLLRVDTGFDATNVLTLRLNIPYAQTPRDSLPGFYAQLLGRLGAIPGVEQAALGDCPPLSGGCNGTMLERKDRPPATSGEERMIGVHWVTPAWFPTLHVPLRKGRLFTDADRFGGAKVVLLNEAAVRRYFPGEDPIGKQVGVYQGGFHTGATVVGVVGDVRFATIDSAAAPDVYLPYEQSPQARMMIYLRTGVDPSSLIPQVRAVVRELSPLYPVYDIRTLEERVAIASAQARLSAGLLTLFAGIALALAVVGIYGVMSYLVTQRSREIGIRMALGADRSSVLRLVVGEGVKLALVGAVIGLGLALGLSRLIAGLLFGVSPTDPVSYVAILLLLVGAAVIASWIPARRASRVSPTEALRAS